MTSQLFVGEDHTAKYRLYRPGYPTELFDYIRNYYFNGKNTDEKIPLAVDVACGSGQATVDLSSFCERVIGTDVSADQISHAIPKDNVEYRCSPGEDLSFLESNSVDLVTIATALHWLDVEKFFQEVKRVLKPHTGVLAVWTYTFGSLENSDADVVYKEFHQMTLQPYQNERQYIINAYYEPLLAIFPYKSSLEQHTIEFRADATLEQFLGTLETASPAQTYRKQNGEQKYQEMFNALRQKFIQSYLKSEGQNDNVQPIDASHIKITHLRPIRLYLVRKTD